MQALQKKMVDEGVVWLQIVSSAPGKQGFVTPEEAQKLRASKNMNSTAMLADPDGRVGQAYGARTTPHMFLINPEGVVVYQGAIDSIRSTRTSDIARAENYLVTAFESAKAGDPVALAETLPYGCSVKY